ncbi:MAG: prepilin peptidase, partial [Candidatus Liptonbacteria bacterium]|nr:prepilin peptidase [Candidatus Liptonbacteria bacterium]
MSAVVRFLFGAVLGSFLNVLALRYNPEKFLLHPDVIGGRSLCPHCGKPLRFYELIPLLSFVIQRGRCRGCKARLGLQYPRVEFASGLIVALVPPAVSRLPQFEFFGVPPAVVYATVVLWTLVFLVLILITLIDVRLKLIPDELSVFLCVLGLALAFFGADAFGGVDGSFLGSYALLFGFRGNIWENRAMAVAFAAVFFGAII